MSGVPAGGPGRLKIKTAGDAVNVEQLSGKIEIRCDAALNGFEIDLAQSHATASDKFLFVQRLPINLEFGYTQLANQFVRSSACQRGPDRFRRNSFFSSRRRHTRFDCD